MGANAPRGLGMIPQRRVANPIILHHSSPIHLAFSILPQRAIYGFPLLDLLDASTLRLQNTSRAAWESDRRTLNAVCDPVTVRTDSFHPTAHRQK